MLRSSTTSYYQADGLGSGGWHSLWFEFVPPCATLNFRVAHACGFSSVGILDCFLLFSEIVRLASALKQNKTYGMVLQNSQFR